MLLMAATGGDLQGGAGESIGEADVVCESLGRRSSWLRAEEASVVLQLSRSEFRAFCLLCPRALLRFLRFRLASLHRAAASALTHLFSHSHSQVCARDPCIAESCHRLSG